MSFLKLPIEQAGTLDNYRNIPNLNKVTRFPEPAAAEFISSGLVMWLDAADASTFTLTGTRVDEWRDKLGSGNLVQTTALGTSYNPSRDATLFGNRGGVNFASPGKYLQTQTSFPLNGTTGWTVIMAMQRTSRNGFWMTTDFSRSKQMVANFQSERFGVGPFINTRHGLPRNIPFIHGTVNTGSTYKFIRNGVADSADNGSIAVSGGALNVVQLGGWQGAAGPAFFYLAGAFYYDRILTDTEILKMYNWIKSNYGIEDVADPTWNFIVHGNSHTLGVGGSNVSTTNEGILAANGSPLATDWLCMSTSGITTPALAAEAATKVDPLYNTSIAANKRILFFWEGTNDIASTLSSDATAFYNSIKSYCQARRAAGWDNIIVGTILPRTGTFTNSANYETVRLSVNTMIRDALTNGETWLDAIADFASDATIGGTAASDNTTYYNTDKLHLKDAGQTIAKTYLTSAINTVTGL